MNEFFTPELLRQRISGEPKENKAVNVLLWVMIAVMTVFVVLKGFVYTTVYVSGGSMLPNLKNGDYLVGNRLSAALGLYGRGDVIVVNVEEDNHGWASTDGKKIIKRVIALEGETVDIKDGLVYIDGKLLDEPYIPSAYVTERIMNGLGLSFPYVVGENEVFVLGDNREISKDSRYKEYADITKSDVFAVIPEWAMRGKGISLSGSTAG